MRAQSFNLQGINLYVNPISSEGAFIRAVNVDSYPMGALKKRPGYITYLGTGNGSAVQNIFQWTNDTGSQSYLYAKRGNVLQFYDVTAGTGDWVTCVNGTFSGTANVGYAVLENTLIVGDGVGSTRHTTNGTAFTDTTDAPIASDFVEYQQRIYAMGTTNTLFASTVGTATNWSLTAPANAFSIQIPGEGRMLRIHKTNNMLIAHKQGGNMFNWDGDSLYDQATNYALTSRESYAETEDYSFWLNKTGIYGSGGNRPELISNPIQPYIYNDFQTGIAGTTFSNAPATVHKFDYYLSVGTISDDITQETVSNAVIKYNFQKNMYHLYSFATRPTAFGVLDDGSEHLLFGDSTGQIYKFGGTALTDNGTPISAVAERLFVAGQASEWKRFNEYAAFFNPGSNAKLQMGVTDTFNRDNLNLIDLGDTSEGAVHYRFPKASNNLQTSRGKLLFTRVYDRSTNARFIWYGDAIDFDVEDVK